MVSVVAGGVDMNPTNPTPVDSTLTGSAVTFQPPPSHRILEICLISARDLSPVSKPLRTYALIWIHPNRKRSTGIDQDGHTSPAWNDKFSFRVNDDFLCSDHSAVHVEIYTSSWFRDALVGTVRVAMSNLITPMAVNGQRFIALQVRRPSGNHQGILNLAVSLINPMIFSNSNRGDMLDLKTKRIGLSVPDCDDVDEDEDEEKQKLNAKIQQWRAMSEGLSDVNVDFPGKPGSMVNGSVCNGSMVNYGSEVCSDIGPSASIVAAEILRKSQLSPVPPKEPPPARRGKARCEDGEESLILEDMTAEEAAAKGMNTVSVERWRTAGPGKAVAKPGGQEKDGAIKCFANAYGFEFTIVCGAGNGNGNGNGSRVTNKASNKSRKKPD
ncbi:hypothetical protein DM860_014194 [Cuscuta australis]|uniref:C2 domain-containing protein n=1 Tax=Cuscuta australis TaxID=267555 RepID=A0A328DI51_9ASTE|nr:hypothetical protein DM860_014194 [Cuscuta australis]